MKENKKDSPEVVKQYAPNDVVEVIVVKEHAFNRTFIELKSH